MTLLAVATLAGSPLPTSAAHGAPTDRASLVASLLQAEDVPTYLADGEVTDMSTDDVAAFAAHDGIREVSMGWWDPERTSAVYDFRFQFPDEASATAFLDDAEELLGEVGNGAVAQEPPATPLPDTRFFRYRDRVLGTGTDGYAFLMHHGNLAAKVWVSGVDGNVSASDAGAIAQAAADRMQRVVGGAPSPEVPVGTGVDPADVAELLSHIPAAVAQDCVPDGTERDASQGELARLVCSQSDVASVLFSLYDTEESLDAQFEVAVMVADVLGWERADSCEAGGYEGTWTLGSETAGRLLCVVQMGTANITWSHPATRILSTIRQGDGDPAAAWQLWLMAGPE